MLHSACGKAAADAGIDLVVGVRGNAQHLAAAACLCGVASIFLPDADTAGEWLVKNLQPGDVVLVKGSRGVQLERAIEIFEESTSPQRRTSELVAILALASCLRFRCFVCRRSASTRDCAQIPDPSWTKPFPPFRIAGNLYYVGSEDLAAYLIVTPQGNILINSNLAVVAAADQEERSNRSASNSATPRFCSSAMATTTTAPAARRSSA